MSYRDALALLKNLKLAKVSSLKSLKSSPIARSDLPFETFETPRAGPYEKIQTPENVPGDSPEAAGAAPCRDTSDTAGAHQRTPQAAWGAADWRTYYDEHATIREFDGRRPRPDAERLAWGELQNEWHLRHGESTPPWQCAGCGKPIGGREALALADGCRVHCDDGLRCLIAYGRRWRAAAARALTAMGLAPPPGEGMS